MSGLPKDWTIREVPVVAVIDGDGRRRAKCDSGTGTITFIGEDWTEWSEPVFVVEAALSAYRGACEGHGAETCRETLLEERCAVLGEALALAEAEVRSLKAGRPDSCSRVAEKAGMPGMKAAEVLDRLRAERDAAVKRAEEDERGCVAWQDEAERLGQGLDGEVDRLRAQLRALTEVGDPPEGWGVDSFGQVVSESDDAGIGRGWNGTALVWRERAEAAVATPALLHWAALQRARQAQAALNGAPEPEVVDPRTVVDDCDRERGRPWLCRNCGFAWRTHRAEGSNCTLGRGHWSEDRYEPRRPFVDATNTGDDEPARFCVGSSAGDKDGAEWTPAPADEYRAHCKAARAEVESWPEAKRDAAEAAFAPPVETADAETNLQRSMAREAAEAAACFASPRITDPAAMEAALTEAAAKGQRVRVEWHPDCKSVWRNRGDIFTTDEGVPQPSGLPLSPWELHAQDDCSYAFAVGQEPQRRVLTIIAVEILGDADTESEAGS